MVPRPVKEIEITKDKCELTKEERDILNELNAPSECSEYKEDELTKYDILTIACRLTNTINFVILNIMLFVFLFMYYIQNHQ